MDRFRPALAAALLTAAAVAPLPAQKGPSERPAKLELTVDSIMRGPGLVGYPPSNLRWSPDSRELYFDWRKPGEDEPSTYVVSRDAGEPRKLSEDQAKNVPPATGGRWDEALRRTLFVDRGDVVIVDATTKARRDVTRTAGSESNPRWARNDTHVTFVRDGSLYIVPVDAAGTAVVAQLMESVPKKSEPRLSDSQKFIREEEEKLLDYVREQKEKKKKTEEKEKADKLQDRQSAADLRLSPDETHVFILVAERPAGTKNTIVPNYVTETGYTEDIPGRTNVGDTQDRRLLAVLNLKTGKTVWADGSFAPPVPDIEKPASPEATGPGARFAGACPSSHRTASSSSPARGPRTTRIAGT